MPFFFFFPWGRPGQEEDLVLEPASLVRLLPTPTGRAVPHTPPRNPSRARPSGDSAPCEQCLLQDSGPGGGGEWGLGERKGRGNPLPGPGQASFTRTCSAAWILFRPAAPPSCPLHLPSGDLARPSCPPQSQGASHGLVVCGAEASRKLPPAFLPGPEGKLRLGGGHDLLAQGAEIRTQLDLTPRAHGLSPQPSRRARLSGPSGDARQTPLPLVQFTERKTEAQGGGGGKGHHAAVLRRDRGFFSVPSQGGPCGS